VTQNIHQSTKPIESIGEFTRHVEQIRKRWDFDDDNPTSPWYRGQQRKHWPLLPTIMRNGLFNRDRSQAFDLETESEIREEFAVRGPALSGVETIPQNEWDAYFLMQHYGAPTRLIDWTESPLIALYFAVRDNPGYYDSAVWILDPFELNQRVIDREEVIAPSAPGTSKAAVKKVSQWLPGRFTSSRTMPKDPVAVLPTHFVRRISSQKSCFTIHGIKSNGFDKFQHKNPCLKRIVIPGFAAPSIRRSLQTQGIDETTIFPDLEGLGRALATKWQRARREAAHDNVYSRLKPSPMTKNGVGVFAIKPIPKGAKIFVGENEEILWTDRRYLPKLRSIRKLYDDFCIIRGERYGSPTCFNRLTVAWFLNESDKPNIRCDENYDFCALRNIRSGEELTVDYDTYSDRPEHHKKP
jgi:FRG domain-containing protein/SET domain-containing protein